jgi:glutamine amidotransferase
MSPRIAILDYGMGNLRSVEKALERVRVDALRTSDPDAARAADGLVLPGVGAFPRAMERVRDLGFDALIADSVEGGTPVLGICLGMQLLFSSTSENDGADGLGLLDGPVEQLDAPGLKVPRIGWSPVHWQRDSRLIEGIDDEEPYYFVHSYAPRPLESSDVLGTTAYGERYACAVERPPLWGVQFHPEKSSAAGLSLLANFAAICSRVGASA